MKTIWSLQIKQDLGLGTLVLINCLLLPTNWWGFEDFDKVWREALLLKLNQNGISGNFLKLLRNFISSRKQRVVLNGQYSSWDNATAGVPQGSALRSSLILIYINDLSDDLSWNRLKLSTFCRWYVSFFSSKQHSYKSNYFKPRRSNGIWFLTLI